MSDVSGIPNIGFGGGNFFAPSFSYNPQMSAGQASAAYMPAENYAQNVTNNLFSSGGGFGRQTDYYSGLGASYSAAGMSPYGVFTEPGAGGGSGGISYNNVTNPNPLDLSGGGGYGGGGGFSSGSLGGFGGSGNAPSIDWSGVGQAAASLGGGANPYPNMSMPGGLGSSFSSPSGAQPFDWGGVFGGGSARADPAPNMPMPGGLGSPMATPFQSPSTDYNTFQGGGSSGGGGGGYTSGIAPDTTGGRDFEWPAAGPGMAMPGGLGSPMTVPTQEPAKTQDQAPFDLSGPTTAWNNAPAAMPDTKAVLGYDPQQFAETDMSNFSSPANRYDMFQAGPSDTSGTGPSADKLAQDAREQLSDLISGAPTKEAVETAEAVEGSMRDFPSASTDYDKFQQAATPRTGYAADTDFLNKRGGHSSILKDGKITDVPIETKGAYKPLNPEFAARLARAAKDFEAATGKRANFGEFSRGEDVQSIYYNRYQSGTGGIAAAPGRSRHQGGEAGDIARGDFRNWLERNGDTYGLHFPVRGDPVHVQMNPSYRGPNYAQPDSIPRPPADVPFPQGVPLPAERPAGAPERAFTPDPEALRPPMSIPPSEGGVPLPAARPAEAPGPVALGPSGVEKAQTFLNTSVEKLLQRYQPDKVGVAGMFIDTKQPLREALKGPYGDQILAGLQPRLGEAELTRNDLVKAIADPRARFMEGGDLGPYPAYTGPEAAPGAGGYTSGIPPDTTGGRDFNGSGGDVYSQFRRSENVEDRRGETEPITDTPIDNTWWQNAAPTASESTSMRDFPSPATDYSAFQQLTPIDPWQASIPAGRNGPEVIDAVKALAARLHTDPAEIAAVVQAETHDSPSALWNPQIAPNRYGYRGLTQMGRDTFTDAARMGTSIGNFPNIEAYQRGTAEQQIDAYGDWLDLYTQQNPQGAAALVNSGALEGLPPGVAAAIMQGAQFAPNATSWVRELEQGNMNVPTTATDQAPELRSKSIHDMTDAAVARMSKWPQQQLWSDYNMPRRPSGY